MKIKILILTYNLFISCTSSKDIITYFCENYKKIYTCIDGINVYKVSDYYLLIDETRFATMPDNYQDELSHYIFKKDLEDMTRKYFLYSGGYNTCRDFIKNILIQYDNDPKIIADNIFNDSIIFRNIELKTDNLLNFNYFMLLAEYQVMKKCKVDNIEYHEEIIGCCEIKEELDKIDLFYLFVDTVKVKRHFKLLVKKSDINYRIDKEDTAMDCSGDRRICVILNYFKNSHRQISFEDYAKNVYPNSYCCKCSLFGRKYKSQDKKPKKEILNLNIFEKKKQEIIERLKEFRERFFISFKEKILINEESRNEEEMIKHSKINKNTGAYRKKKSFNASKEDNNEIAEKILGDRKAQTNFNGEVTREFLDTNYCGSDFEVNCALKYDFPDIFGGTSLQKDFDLLTCDMKELLNRSYANEDNVPVGANFKNDCSKTFETKGKIKFYEHLNCDEENIYKNGTFTDESNNESIFADDYNTSVQKKSTKRNYKNLMLKDTTANEYENHENEILDKRRFARRILQFNDGEFEERQKFFDENFNCSNQENNDKKEFDNNELNIKIRNVPELIDTNSYKNMFGATGSQSIMDPNEIHIPTLKKYDIEEDKNLIENVEKCNLDKTSCEILENFDKDAGISGEEEGVHETKLFDIENLNKSEQVLQAKEILPEKIVDDECKIEEIAEIYHSFFEQHETISKMSYIFFEEYKRNVDTSIEEELKNVLSANSSAETLNIENYENEKIGEKFYNSSDSFLDEQKGILKSYSVDDKSVLENASSFELCKNDFKVQQQKNSSCENFDKFDSEKRSRSLGESTNTLDYFYSDRLNKYNSSPDLTFCTANNSNTSLLFQRCAEHKNEDYDTVTLQNYSQYSKSPENQSVLSVDISEDKLSDDSFELNNTTSKTDDKDNNFSAALNNKKRISNDEGYTESVSPNSDSLISSQHSPILSGEKLPLNEEDSLVLSSERSPEFTEKNKNFIEKELSYLNLEYNTPLNKVLDYNSTKQGNLENWLNSQKNSIETNQMSENKDKLFFNDQNKEAKMNSVCNKLEESGSYIFELDLLKEAKKQEEFYDSQDRDLKKFKTSQSTKNKKAKDQNYPLVHDIIYENFFGNYENNEQKPSDSSYCFQNNEKSKSSDDFTNSESYFDSLEFNINNLSATDAVNMSSECEKNSPVDQKYIKSINVNKEYVIEDNKCTNVSDMHLMASNISGSDNNTNALDIENLQGMSKKVEESNTRQQSSKDISNEKDVSNMLDSKKKSKLNYDYFYIDLKSNPSECCQYEDKCKSNDFNKKISGKDVTKCDNCSIPDTCHIETHKTGNCTNVIIQNPKNTLVSNFTGSKTEKSSIENNKTECTVNNVLNQYEKIASKENFISSNCIVGDYVNKGDQNFEDSVKKNTENETSLSLNKTVNGDFDKQEEVDIEQQDNKILPLKKTVNGDFDKQEEVDIEQQDNKVSSNCKSNSLKNICHTKYIDPLKPENYFNRMDLFVSGQQQFNTCKSNNENINKKIVSAEDTELLNTSSYLYFTEDIKNSFVKNMTNCQNSKINNILDKQEVEKALESSKYLLQNNTNLSKDLVKMSSKDKVNIKSANCNNKSALKENKSINNSMHTSLPNVTFSSDSSTTRITSPGIRKRSKSLFTSIKGLSKCSNKIKSQSKDKNLEHDILNSKLRKSYSSSTLEKSKCPSFKFSKFTKSEDKINKPKDFSFPYKLSKRMHELALPKVYKSYEEIYGRSYHSTNSLDYYNRKNSFSNLHRKNTNFEESRKSWPTFTKRLRKQEKNYSSSDKLKLLNNNFKAVAELAMALNAKKKSRQAVKVDTSESSTTTIKLTDVKAPLNKKNKKEESSSTESTMKKSSARSSKDRNSSSTESSYSTRSRPVVGRNVSKLPESFLADGETMNDKHGRAFASQRKIDELSKPKDITKIVTKVIKKHPELKTETKRKNK